VAESFTLDTWTCRQCSSGLQAIACVAAAIKAGYYNIGLAGGVESMSSNPMTWEGGVNPAIERSKHAQSCMLPMGITSENVASQFGLSRYLPASCSSSERCDTFLG
jgi:acetyl-CoA acyltransferase 1